MWFAGWWREMLPVLTMNGWTILLILNCTVVTNVSMALAARLSKSAVPRMPVNVDYLPETPRPGLFKRLRGPLPRLKPHLDFRKLKRNRFMETVFSTHALAPSEACVQGS